MVPADEPLSEVDTTGPPVTRKNDVLAEICRAIVRTGDPDEVVQDVTERLQQYFGTASVGIYFRHDDELLLKGLCLPDRLAEDHVDRIRERWQRIPWEAELPGNQSMREGTILRWSASDPKLNPGVRSTLEDIDAGTLLAIPITVDDETPGCAMVATPEEHPLTGSDELLLESAVGVVGIVYQRARLQRLEREHQRRALHAYHMAAVGELAAGVAHEVNNPLDAIGHLVELLLEDPDDPERATRLEEILTQTRAASEVLRNLQVFARRVPSSEDSEDREARPEVALEGALGLMETQLELAGIEVRTRIADDLPRVPISESELRMVFHNILTNARQAIEAVDEEGTVRIDVTPVDGMVEIKVDDTGPGFPESVRHSAFRPFYTTKGPGRGTGMGLATAYGIVTDRAGEIRAENWGRPRVFGGRRTEGGARIRLRLPAAGGASSSAPDPLGTPKGGLVLRERRGLRILVVEDEKRVADPLVRYLERRGHEPELAPDAETAVEVLKEEPAPELIISDYRMPGMGGAGLFQHLEEHHSGLLDRLIFVSGDVVTPETRAFLDSSGCPFLAKPYTFEELEAVMALIVEADS